MRYLHVQQLQSDGELKIHYYVSTENNPAYLMTKYLETAKIKIHSETIGLHPYIGSNRGINMISRGSLRPRGSYTTRPRGSPPQPRQRIPAYIEVNEEYIVKVEERDEGELPMIGQLQYFVEEAARDDVIEK
eukprot:1691944-Amphidinium_carterae.3